MALSDLCRCCLEFKDDKEDMISLSSDWENSTIIELIESLTKTEIKENIDLPSHICFQCLEKFFLAEEIVMKFNESDKILHGLIEANTEIKLDEAIEKDVESLEASEMKEDSSGQLDINDEKESQKQLASKDQKTAIGCSKCNQTFSCSISFAKHLCILRPFCYYCNENFHTKKFLIQHLIEAHATQNNELVCNFENCQFKCLRPYTIMYHLAGHYDPLDLVCPVCSKLFSDYHRYRKHLSRHNNKQVLICDFCGSEIQSKINMIRHIKTKHLKHRVYCDSCPASFVNMSLLRKHKANHSKVMEKQELSRNLTCKDCSITFKRRQTLQNHIRAKHQKLKDFLCPYDGCGSAFGRNSTLQIHIRQHTSEKPFECPKCPNSCFSDPSAFSRHMLKIHDTKYSRKHSKNL